MGKPSQATRTRKLFDIFTCVSRVIKKQEEEVEATKLVELLALPRPLRTSDHDMVISMIKRIMAEQGKKDQEKVIESQKRYLKVISKAILDSGLEARMTNPLRRLLVENHPLLGAVGDLNNRLTGPLIDLENADEERVFEIFSNKLLLTTVDEGVFSIRRSKSTILAQSRLTKDLLTLREIYLKEGEIKAIKLWFDSDKEVIEGGSLSST